MGRLQGQNLGHFTLDWAVTVLIGREDGWASGVTFWSREKLRVAGGNLTAISPQSSTTEGHLICLSFIRRRFSRSDYETSDI
jgi:hypothetical protein